MYGAVGKNIDELNDINDIKNTDGEFNINSDDVEQNLNEVKLFMKKTNKAKHEKKEINIKEDDITNLIKDRKNIDELLFDNDNDAPKKSRNSNISNVIKRKSKSEIAEANAKGIDMKKYEITSGSKSKFKDLVKANANDKIEKNLNLNLKNNLGDIHDFYA